MGIRAISWVSEPLLACRHQGCAQQGHSVPPPLHARCAALPRSAVAEGQPPRAPQDRQPCQQQACPPLHTAQQAFSTLSRALIDAVLLAQGRDGSCACMRDLDPPESCMLACRRSSDAGQTSRPETAQQDRTPAPIPEGAKLEDSQASPKASTPAPAAAASAEPAPAPASGAALSSLGSSPGAQPAPEPAKGAATKPDQGLQASEPVKALPHSSSSASAVKPAAPPNSQQANGDSALAQDANEGANEGAAAPPTPSPAETMMKQPAELEASQTPQEKVSHEGKVSLPYYILAQTSRRLLCAAIKEPQRRCEPASR